MFKPKTKKIEELSYKYPEKIKGLESLLDKANNIYIDYANIYHWQAKLGFHIDFKRLKQLLNSFDTVKQVKIYQGVIQGDVRSEELLKELKNCSYIIRTKPVKEMYLSVDVSSVNKSDPSILKNYINKSLLAKLDIETIEFLNAKLAELNIKGTKSIKHLKCNFDVEIASDMIVDSIMDESIKKFILFSGDSDFADTINQLNSKGKDTAIVSTARRISVELSNTGTFVYELKKIREFICWTREL